MNDKGTHFYVDGKRISKSVALDAIEAYERSQEEAQKDTSATNIANNVVENKENIQESQREVSSEIDANLKDMIISVSDLRDVIDYIYKIAETKSVKEKVALYENAPALVRWFIDLTRQGYRIGAYYKRFVKDAKDFGINPIDSEEINLYQLRKVIDELTENNTVKKVVLNKDEFAKLASVVPMLDPELGDKFFKVLNGRVKLGIPSKFLK